MKNSVVRRLGVLGASGALVATGLTLAGPVGAAQAATDPAPVAAAAEWVIAQNEGGEVFGLGGKIDIAVALEAVGGYDTAFEALAGEVHGQIAGYINTDYTYEGSHYTGINAGGAAKAAMLALKAGDDPRSYNGEDLVDLLEGRTISGGPSDGRLADEAFRDGDPYPEGDYVNAFSQAYAARVLALEGSPRADEARDFLLDQQCSEGFFRLYFNYDKGALNQGCDDAVPAETVPGADSTAVVVLMLADLADSDPVIADAIADARSWLLSQQAADGSFPGGDATNTNTAGLAGWALGALGDTAAAAKAATWVRGLQHTGVAACEPRVAAEKGAIAYSAEAFTDALAEGFGFNRWQWIGATSQALPVLRWAPAATGARALTGPTGFVKAGTNQSLTVAGIAPGERACVTGGAGTVDLVGAASAATVPVKAAATTGITTYTLNTSGGAATASVKTLAAKKLKFARKKKVRKGNKQKIVVRGLAPGEKVKVKIRKKTKTGTANAKGRFTTKIVVRGKVGKTKIKVRGEFPGIRKNDKKFKVLRKKR